MTNSESPNVPGPFKGTNSFSQDWPGIYRSRVDLLIRERLVEEYLLGEIGPQVLDIYLRMINRRNRGREGAKTGVHDFRASFTRLIESIKKDGFNRECPIQISSTTGQLVDGAHRLSICRSLGVQPRLEAVLGEGRSWDAQWFVENSFSKKDLNYLAKLIFQKFPNNLSVGVVWGSSAETWRKIKTEFGTSLFLNFQYRVPPHSFSQLVFDLYSLDSPSSKSHAIQQKVSFLRGVGPEITVFVVWTDDWKGLAAGKKKLGFCLAGPEKRSLGFHLADSPREAHYDRQLLLSDTNDFFYQKRRLEFENPAFEERLIRASHILAEAGIPQDEACIVGGGVLQAFGLRTSDDVDFVASRAHRGKIAPEGPTQVEPGVDFARTNYSRSVSGTPLPDDDLVHNSDRYFMSRGFKFANLEVIRARKIWESRQSDIGGVLEIDSLMGNGGLREINHLTAHPKAFVGRTSDFLRSWPTLRPGVLLYQAKRLFQHPK